MVYKCVGLVKEVAGVLSPQSQTNELALVVVLLVPTFNTPVQPKVSLTVNAMAGFILEVKLTENVSGLHPYTLSAINVTVRKVAALVITITGAAAVLTNMPFTNHLCNVAKVDVLVIDATKGTQSLELAILNCAFATGFICNIAFAVSLQPTVLVTINVVLKALGKIARAGTVY